MASPKRDIKGRFLAKGVKGDLVNARLILDLKFEQYQARLKAALQKPIVKVCESIADEAARSMAYVGDRSEASAPGTPPHTHTQRAGRSLAKSFKIVKAVQTRHGVYGKVESRHFVAALHEKGGTVSRGQQGTAHYPARPFMKPALEKVKARMPSFFKRVKVTGV